MASAKYFSICSRLLEMLQKISADSGNFQKCWKQNIRDLCKEEVEEIKINAQVIPLKKL